MHRIKGGGALALTQPGSHGEGGVLQYSSIHPPPPPLHHQCPLRLFLGNDERAGGDAVGARIVLTLSWDCPLARAEPVGAAQLPSPPSVCGCDLYACEPCLKSSSAVGRSDANDGSPRCVIVLSPSTIFVFCSRITLRPSVDSSLDAEKPSHSANVTSV